MKLIELKMDPKPVKWNENIPRSKANDGWLIEDDKGGYTVQPEPKPSHTIAANDNNSKPINNNQKDNMFKRGNIRS